MTLHILKLCVGCSSLEELVSWQRRRLQTLKEGNPDAVLMHVTRQTPRREGFASGSSLYWVIGGFIRCRQRIVELREVRGGDNVLRCGLVLEPQLMPTEPVPRRPFQGWRYLPQNDTPPDLDPHAPSPESAIPSSMRQDLMELRLI